METYFDTIYNRHYVQATVKELVASTLYKMTHLGHPDDPIFSYYSEVLEMLLYMVNEQTALAIIESASVSGEEFSTIIDNIVQMNNQYKSPTFFDRVLEISKKFERSNHWDYIKFFIEEGRLCFPTEDEIKEHSFFNKNVTEMIEFINNSNDKFLDIIFWNAEEFAVRYQSHKLINVIEKNLYKIKDSPNYTSILVSLGKAKIILGQDIV